jgi:hypothetical protein
MQSDKRIDRRLKKGFFIIGLFLLLVPAVVCAAEAGKKLGDNGDGSRGQFVHVINLLDEKGRLISSYDKKPQPFSIRQTCDACHSYDIISRGWHFNAPDANVPPGRPGQPWIYVDPATATQIPISYRPWPGTFTPTQLGVSPWQFTLLFGRHTPGGGAGELDSDVPEEIMRQFVSGKLEINCLSCHSGHRGQDQGGTTGYAANIARQNFRWAAAASCEFAWVTGSASAQPETYDPLLGDKIKVQYRNGTFGYRDRVLFDLVREAPSRNCYYCHSNRDILKPAPDEKWQIDEDVHLAAGLTCVDCHRNGLAHNIIRGYEGEDSMSQHPVTSASTCKGCHLGTESSPPDPGRLGAPVPKHPGIPPVHFEKLTCTACHSGLWPAETTYSTKTARAHKLGLANSHKFDEALPHIMTPVLAKQQDGKIGPHKLIWPAFWAEATNEAVSPIDLETVNQTAGAVLAKVPLPKTGDWPDITAEHIEKALRLLSSEASFEGKPAYVCAGTLYQLDESGKLTKDDNHPAAAPYLWPIAHDVRPAAQSLGVRKCEDCHRLDAPFTFGGVAVDSPLGESLPQRRMYAFQDISPGYMKAFAFSFVFRPWLKVVVLGSCACLAGVCLWYLLKALGHILRVLAEEKE